MSSPAPAESPAATPSASPARSGLRVGDLIACGGALLALVSTFLPFESDDYGHITIWHSDFLGSLFAVIVAIAAAVLAAVRGGRSTPLIPRLGLTAAALAAVAAAAAVVFYVAGLLTFSQKYLAASGPTLGAIGIVAVAVGTIGAAMSSPGSGLATRRGDSGPPKAAQPSFGQFGPAGPAFGYAGPGQGGYQQSSGQAPSYAQQPSGQQPSSQHGDVPSAVGAVRAGAEPVSPQPVSPQPATFAPYWAGVVSPIPAFSPAEAGTQVGEVTPGRWYLVTGQHPAGLLIDLGGRPVLVRDVVALVRG